MTTASSDPYTQLRAMALEQAEHCIAITDELVKTTRRECARLEELTGAAMLPATRRQLEVAAQYVTEAAAALESLRQPPTTPATVAETADLGDLQRTTDEILKDLVSGRHLSLGMANPADLCCTVARRIFDTYGDCELEVILEEASPDAFFLQKAVSEALEERGFPGVVVRTEW